MSTARAAVTGGGLLGFPRALPPCTGGLAGCGGDYHRRGATGGAAAGATGGGAKSTPGAWLDLHLVLHREVGLGRKPNNIAVRFPELADVGVVVLDQLDVAAGPR